ncbi:MAG: anthranilate phosphoribosyltransferase, partial [Sphingomonas sp.]|nr:anthranilate phosphoribosyltransferase [Sphingomonas sp.]
ADALAQLGTEAALVVSGEEGLDELSGAGPSIVVSVGDISLPSTVAPEDGGLARQPIAALRGGDPAYNAAALRRLLLGETGAYRDAVLLNAAAALMLAGRVASLTDGVEEAGEVLDNGLASALLDCWIAYS